MANQLGNTRHQKDRSVTLLHENNNTCQLQVDQPKISKSKTNDDVRIWKTSETLSLTRLRPHLNLQVQPSCEFRSFSMITLKVVNSFHPKFQTSLTTWSYGMYRNIRLFITFHVIIENCSELATWLNLQVQKSFSIIAWKVVNSFRSQF